MTDELDRMFAEFHGEISRLQGLQHEIEEIRGRGTAADGRIVAETTMTGALAALTIDPRAMRLGSGELAEAILGAAAAAAQDAADRAKALMEPFTPDELR
ncbi:YbaB/EbfC family nucleoid-associated protein [Nonomuraea typhae]|uniref:YbaB/EbfC family nucleoid-associated protein n=1 Tax=Nonomuraea typhae TaxID=2603600 RepID=UPI0012FA88EE|nr:YbaB/EbfC family nucleoid-associated protein [Nonomuraea typhae]